MPTYSGKFDERSIHWTNDAERNRIFLSCQETYVNHLLRARGHVFLNEVHDLLGLDRTSDGQLVGWIMKDGEGHERIDFGMILLDDKAFDLQFDVDGVIYEQI